MQKKIVQEDGSLRTVEVTFSMEEREEIRKGVIRCIGAGVKMSGFRPGKVPESILCRNFAEEISEKMAKELQQKAVEAAEVAVGQSIHRVLEITQGEDGLVRIHLELCPKIFLPDWEDIVLPLPADESVSEHEVDRALWQTLRWFAKQVSVDRPAKLGDHVCVSLVGFLPDGTAALESYPELQSLEKDGGIHLVVGEEVGWEVEEEEKGEANSVPMTLSSAIVGMVRGESRTISVTFPKGFSPKMSTSQEIIYECKLCEVKEFQTSDVLLRQFGVIDCDELKGEIRNIVELQREDDRRKQQREAVIQFLTERCQFPLPAGDQSGVVKEILSEMLEQLKLMSQEEVESQREFLVQLAEKKAEQRQRLAFIVDAVARQESIVVEKSDMESVVLLNAMKVGMPPKTFWTRCQKDPNWLQQLWREAINDKVLDWIVTKVKETKFPCCNVPEALAPSTADEEEGRRDTANE